MKVVSIHINTQHPQEMGAFYQQLLGVSPAWQSDSVTGFMVDDFRLEVARHDQVKGPNTNPERLFFDLMVDDVEAEFKRLVALGAGVIQAPYSFADEDMRMMIATLSDPDGNYFQLVSMTNITPSTSA